MVESTIMRIMKLNSIHILILIFLLQTKAIAQELEITGLPFSYHENPSTIVGMTQDNKGYIWMVDIGNGLFQYDGTNLISYKAVPDDPNSLSANRLECITADSEGNIWIGSFSRGLNKYNPVTGLFTQYRHDENNNNSIRSDHIRAMAFDDNGMLWIGTANGLDMMDPTSGKFTHVHTEDPDELFLSKEHIRVLYFDRAGILWIGSSSPFADEQTIGGLFKLDRKEKSINHYINSDDPNSLIDNRVRSIFEDSRGTFWIGTAGDGLHTMDRSTGLFQRHQYDEANSQKLSRSSLASPIDHITFINEDETGHIWIGTLAEGLIRYDPDTKTKQHYSINAAGNLNISTNGFWTSLRTDDGLLWISSWVSTNLNNTLFQINCNPNKLTHINTSDMGPTQSFVEDDFGNIYIGTSWGVWKINTEGRQTNILRYELSDPGDWSYSNMELDENGNLWVASTYYGLYFFNTQTGNKRIYTHDPKDTNSISHNMVRAVESLGNGKLLVGTVNGLNLFDAETGHFKKIDYYSSDSSKKEIFINRILKDSRDLVWVRTANDGFKKLDLSTGNFENVGYGEGAGNVYAIYEDKKGTFWIGGRTSGLEKYDSTEDDFTSFTSENGLLSGSTGIYDIAEDSENNLWLQTTNGYIRLDPENKEATLFGLSWGVSFNQLSSGSLASSKGDFYMGTISGYYKFNPKDLHEIDEVVRIPFINKLYVEDEPVRTNGNNDFSYSSDMPDHLDFDHDENTFSFEVGHIDYLTTANDRRLQHKLEGYDKAWRNSYSGDLVSYYNVPPGQYDFHLRASNINGSTVDRVFNINISPPWWKTWWAYSLYVIGLALGIWFVHRYQKERTIRREREKTRERELAHAKEIEKAYADLKSTQSQLIQSEKMASLGELTAGIAHEIQNPLNFVNNFSEVSSELVAEAKEELDKGEIEEAKEVLNDLRGNLEKITHHGDRASNIVKGMLDHSRESTGEKELTDINALCDEYLRLSYHGMRAKDKSFNADFKTNLDQNLPNVKVIPQDIGRVLLNVFNNAFYAVHQREHKALKAVSALDRSKTTGKDLTSLQDLSDLDKPKVTVTTKKLEQGIEITIEDNGIGMSQETMDKVFQPFFTTKPTGQGTGLGLSLSYDIVKAHDGELKVISEEGKGSEFIITLPSN